MRAVILRDSDSELAIEEVPDPEPSDDELLIRVRGSSVNPIDAYEATGALTSMNYDFPVGSGTDFAGEVERAGSGVTGRAPGDEVLGLRQNPGGRDGTWAELIVIAADHPFLAPKPAGIEHTQAGAAPLAGVTALALVEPLELSSGDTVLIVGGTGGVGSFAVQLAAGRGAAVIAPGLAEDEQYLGDLGAAEVVDREGDGAAAVRARHPDGVDAVIDLVSRDPGAFDSNASALKQDGRASSPLGAAGDGPGRFNAMGTSDPARVATLAGLLESGQLRVPIQRTYPFAEIGQAVSDLLGTHVRGKLAIAVG
jgi:NADPH2:quinone reductase